MALGQPTYGAIRWRIWYVGSDLDSCQVRAWERDVTGLTLPRSLDCCLSVCGYPAWLVLEYGSRMLSEKTCVKRVRVKEFAVPNVQGKSLLWRNGLLVWRVEAKPQSWETTNEKPQGIWIPFHFQTLRVSTRLKSMALIITISEPTNKRAMLEFWYVGPRSLWVLTPNDPFILFICTSYT
jgi:hypothetical protein